MAESNTVDLQQAQQFIDILTGEDDSLLTFQIIGGTSKILHGSLEEHADELIRQNDRGAGIFITVNETDGQGRKVENVTRVRAVCADTDGADLSPITNCDLEPHIVVESSPGKYWAYWLVDGLAPGEFAGIQKAIAKRFGTDASISDLPRVARLPGFMHRKGEPFQSRIIINDGGLPYNDDQIRHQFPPVEPEQIAAQPQLGTEHDDTLKALSDAGYLAKQVNIGKWSLICPWQDSHTTESTDTSTVYYEAHTNGYRGAAFVCKHEHCQGRTLADVLELLGMDAAPTEASLMTKAKNVTPETDYFDILDIAIAAYSLTKAQYGAILKMLSESTGRKYNITDLKADVKDTKQDAAGDMGLGEMIVRNIGPRNIIADEGNLAVYNGAIWQSKGVRAVRQMVSRELKALRGGGDKKDVDGAVDAAHTAAYKGDVEWNSGPEDTVCMLNGVLSFDGDKWHLGPQRRHDYRTVQLPHMYDPDATAPRFEQYLNEAFDGEPDAEDKKQCLLELVGYTMMGQNNREIFAVLNGRPGSGKSVFLNVVENIIGKENATNVDPTKFNQDYHRADLFDSLANLVTELPEGALLPDAQIKSITSGETISARRIYKSPFTFKPVATIWIATNHMPGLRDHSGAVQDRARVIEFNKNFRMSDKKDVNLSKELAKEAPGIINMALKAYAKVINTSHFTEPQSSVEAKRQWAYDADQIAQFVDECLEAVEHRETPKIEIWEAYQRWAREAGIRSAYTRNKFYARMQDFYPAGSNRYNRAQFVGVAIKKEAKAGGPPLSVVK